MKNLTFERCFALGYLIVSIWMFWPWYFGWPVTPFWFWFVASTALAARGSEMFFRTFK